VIPQFQEMLLGHENEQEKNKQMRQLCLYRNALQVDSLPEPFSALTLLVRRQEGHQALKKSYLGFQSVPD